MSDPPLPIGDCQAKGGGKLCLCMPPVLDATSNFEWVKLPSQYSRLARREPIGEQNKVGWLRRAVTLARGQ